MSVVPAVMDALVTSWVSACGQVGLRAIDIKDGPQEDYIGTEGLAVGATLIDTVTEFTHQASGLAGESEQGVVPSLAWSGGGTLAFKPRRDRVNEFLAVVRAELDRDRTLGGAVSTARFVGGAFDQVAVGGALVMCEFRIEYRKL